MHLLQLQSINLVRIIIRTYLCVITFALTSCATSMIQESKTLLPEASGNIVVAEQIEQIIGKTNKIKNITLTPALVYYLLMAEIASQRGNMEIAVELYHQASMETESPTLAERSARAALLTQNQQRINRALDRWSKVDTANINVYIMQASILLMQGDYNSAMKSIDTALVLGPRDTKKFLVNITKQLA